MDEDVLKWMKRLNRKGPFYLLRAETKRHTIYRWDGQTRHETPTTKQVYWVIWNDGDKTKIGAFKDYMFCRYGVETRAVLNGDTPFDLWNGSGLDPADFNEMLKVRNHASDLGHFDLKSLVGLVH